LSRTAGDICEEGLQGLLRMLTRREAEALDSRLDQLSCTDREFGDGLFVYVFKREPLDQAARYESHMRACERCRIALQVYRYKRDVAELLDPGGRARA
jgi:hypothetical protein